MNAFAEDVRRGLSATPKVLQPHYFYDALGSALFNAICELPEYYVTRAETEILTSHAAQIAAAFGEPVRMVELGSGSARKSRLLIEAILARQDELEYIPVDVDAGMLESSASSLLDEFSELTIHAVCADFRDPAAALRDIVVRPDVPDPDQHTVVLFLGSSVGNLDLDTAVTMLASLRSVLAPGDMLFLGADLKKPREILEPAYDDPLGVTAAFNLNLLARINRELGGDFDLASFAHRAFYNEADGRIEMHLVSRRAQRVCIGDYAVDFAEGESIHTENSHKYDDATLEALASRAGFRIETRWTDSRGWFADLLLIAA
jgi:L-histidine Nalpha-methyltransferase